MTVIECESEEQLKALKEKALKCKVIALDKIGKHPLYNPHNMKDSEKKKLFNSIKELFDKPIEEIDPLFNEITQEKLLDGSTDISTYPVYDLSRPEVDIDGQKIEY